MAAPVNMKRSKTKWVAECYDLLTEGMADQCDRGGPVLGHGRLNSRENRGGGSEKWVYRVYSSS